MDVFVEVGAAEFSVVLDFNIRAARLPRFAIALASRSPLLN